MVDNELITPKTSKNLMFSMFFRLWAWAVIKRYQNGPGPLSNVINRYQMFGNDLITFDNDFVPPIGLITL